MGLHALPYCLTRLSDEKIFSPTSTRYAYSVMPIRFYLCRCTQFDRIPDQFHQEVIIRID